MDQQEELEYIRRVRNGEHAAYSFLVDRYKGMVYSIAWRVLGNQEDAQDVAQEGFIKAYQQLYQFEGKSKFSTWLYTIVYRTALAKAKEAKVRTFSITEQFKETFTNDYSTPQLTLMQTDDEQRSVNLAINNLPKTEGLLVILYYIDENSISEIRQITGLSMANIKIKLFRARKKLERKLRFLLDDKTTERRIYGKQGDRLRSLLRKFELQSPPDDFTKEVIKEIDAMAGDKVYTNQKLKAVLSKNLTAAPSTGFTYSVLNRVRHQGQSQDHYPPIISKKAWASIITFVMVCLVVSVGVDGKGGQVTELFLTPLGNYLSTLTSKLLEPMFYLGVITLSVGLLLLIDYFFRKILRLGGVD